jgi:hypothetical protein
MSDPGFPVNCPKCVTRLVYVRRTRRTSTPAGGTVRLFCHPDGRSTPRGPRDRNGVRHAASSDAVEDTPTDVVEDGRSRRAAVLAQKDARTDIGSIRRAGGQRKPISICSADADGGSGLVSAIEKNLAHTPVYAADECLQQESRDARARRGDSLHVVQLRQGSRLTENVASNGGWRNGSAVGSGGRHPFAGW